MIEIIYNEENKENSMGKLHIPKNIRQIGEIESKHRIYIEDYVFSYVNKIIKKDIMLPKVAILLGRTSKDEGRQYIFIGGAAEITDFVEVRFNNVIFSESAWTNIYEEIKRFFDDMEIVGWYLYIQDETPGISANIRKSHIDNFAGNDKLLMLQTDTEKEEAFYIYNKGQLIKQKGYYIYYEKNQAMQEYMIYHSEEEKVEKSDEVSDHAVKSFRNMLQEKKDETHQKKIMTFMYTTSTFLVMIVLIIGVTMLNNYDKMKSMEVVLNQISQSVTREVDEGDEEEIEEEIVVEKVKGEVEPEDEVINQEAVAENEAAAAEVTPADTETETADSETTDTESGEVPSQEASNPEATIAEESTDSGQDKYYTVVRGDTLVGISKKIYNTEGMVNEICSLNQIENGDQIYAGQEILLP